jgi:hypothetical protein
MKLLISFIIGIIFGIALFCMVPVFYKLRCESYYGWIWKTQELLNQEENFVCERGNRVEIQVERNPIMIFRLIQVFNRK